MKLGIDLDGVVFDFVGAMNRWAWKHHRQREVSADRWDWYKKWNQPAMFRTIMNEHEFWMSVEPYEGAIDALNMIAKMGHDITFITHRPVSSDAATSHALAWWEQFHPLVTHSGNKADPAKERGIVWTLDDLPATVTNYHRAGITTYLFDRPWNQDAGHERLHSWEHVIQQIDSDSREEQGK